MSKYDFKSDKDLGINQSSHLDLTDPTALNPYPYLKELYDSGDPIKIVAARVLQHAWVKQTHYFTMSASGLRKVIDALPPSYTQRIGLAGSGYTRAKSRLLEAGVMELVQKTLAYKQGRKAHSDLYKLTPTGISLIGISPERQAEVQVVADLHLQKMFDQAAVAGLPDTPPAPVSRPEPTVNPGARRFVPKRADIQ